MISSSALGNPGIFERSNALLRGEGMPASNWDEKLSDFHTYLHLAEKMGVLQPKSLRAHAIEFLTGQPGVKLARKKLNSAKTVEDIALIMEEFAPIPASGS